MMFAEPEHIEADPIGELDLLDDVSESLVDIDRLAGARVAPGLDEGVSAELHEDLDRSRFSRGRGDVKADCNVEPAFSQLSTRSLTASPRSTGVRNV